MTNDERPKIQNSVAYLTDLMIECEKICITESNANGVPMDNWSKGYAAGAKACQSKLRALRWAKIRDFREELPPRKFPTGS